MNQVAICICHHTGRLILKCVESIRKSTGVPYQIYISTSDLTLLKEGIEDCIISYNPHPPTTKRNEMAENITHKYIVFMDDDVEVKFDAIKELVRAIEKPNVGMVYAKLFNAERRSRLDEAGGFLTFAGFIWSRAEQNIKDERRLKIEEPIFSGKSALCIISRELFWKVGGFDEDFGILGEESDLSWRVWLSGKIVLFCPSSIGYHYFNTKWKPVEKHYTTERVQYNGCRNYITMLIKNLGRRNLWLIVPIHMVIWNTVGLVMLITGKPKQGWSILRGIMYVMRNLRHITKKRAVVQRQRVVVDKEIWPYIFRRTRWAYYKQRLFRYLRTAIHG